MTSVTDDPGHLSRTSSGEKNNVTRLQEEIEILRAQVSALSQKAPVSFVCMYILCVCTCIISSTDVYFIIYVYMCI